MNITPVKCTTQWSFRWRQYNGKRVWLIYRHRIAGDGTTMSAKLIGTGSEDFITKGEARAWAMGRARFEGVPYVEHKKPKKEKPPPETPASRLRCSLRKTNRLLYKGHLTRSRRDQT